MEKKFKLFKIQTVNRQSTDGQSLRQYSVSTRLFRLAALFTLLFTIAVGQMWAVETIPAGTIVYVDVTNFSGTSYDDSYYMSVTDGDGYNLDRVADKSNTAGVADYWPAGDKEWQELHQVSGNLYAGKVENEQSGGKLSFWSKDESTYNNAYEVNASLAREWSSTNRKFVFQSGSTWYDKKDNYNQRHVSCFTSSSSSIEVFTGGQVLYVKVDNWTSDNPNFEACFLGYDGQTWVSCEHVDGNYYSATVPEGEWPYVIFVRMDPSKAAHSWDSKWTQTADIAPSGTKNCVFITSSAGAYSFDKYAPSPVLTGDFNNWSPDANPFNANGIATAELPANSVYEIKVFSGTTWYGLNGTNVYGQEDTYTLNGTGASIKLHTTAVDGTYKFTWNASNNKLSIEYPDVPHPNAGYLYFLNDQGWDPVAVHVWGGKYGTTWGSNPAVSSFNWDGTDYYYVAMGDHTGAIFGQGIDNDHKTDDLTKDEEGSLGKFYKKSDTKGWYDFTATLTLKTNQGETTNPSPTSVTVTYGKPTHINEDVITTTSPAKTGYTFGGYYTAAGGSGTQVINTSEKIPSNLSGYTTDGIWTKTGSSVSADLYAKWTQSVPLDKENGESNGSVTLTYNSASHAAITNPTKTNYTFEGWYSGDDGAGQQIINTSGVLQANKTDGVAFTGADGVWIHAGSAPTLHAKWSETPRTITTSSGEGGSVDAASYTAYVATATAISATPATGYKFHSWEVISGDVTFADQYSASTTMNATSDAEIKANFVYQWSVAGSWLNYPATENWDADTYAMGNITKDGDDDVCSVEVTLSANTNYTFKIADRAANPYEYWGNNTSTFYMAYGNSSNWRFGTDASNTAACGLTTAGAGTYTFTYNITQHKVSVTYPESFQVTAAGNPAAGGTVTPSSATYMSTSVGGEITATPDYSHYFNGWTSSAGGTFTSASSATTTFKPASAAATVTAAFAERTAFIEGNFQIYNSTRATRTKTGDSWQDGSTNIKMTYDAVNNRYYLHTYSTPAELAEQLNSADAYFYIKTSTSSSSIADAATYKAYSSAVQSLTAYGESNKKATGSTEHSFKFTGSEDGYVIIYFNGTHVWYELECALSYYGGEGATGDAPAARTYYAYDSNQTAASNTYSKTGYNFANWNTASGGGGTTYAAGATNVAMNAHEVCLHAQWTPKTYTVRFENLGADAGHKGSLDTVVTYNDTINMKSGIVVPSKTYYDFGGYYISTDGGVTLTSTQIIDANGAWVKNVSGYTGEKGNIASWVCDGDTTLYAKWTEHAYTITTAVSPAGAGSVSCGSSTTAKYVTASGDITATANAGWVFKEWRFSKTDETYDAYSADGYSSLVNPVRINAVHDGTLTAVFEPRYYLVGKIWDDSADGGMPGWANYDAPFNVVTSSPVLATCSRTLSTDATFYIMVLDKADGFSYGKENSHLGDGDELVFTDKDNKVMFYSNGGTAYTFKITAVNGDGRPTVSVERPYQVNVGRKRVDIDGTDHDDNTGGTAAMSETLSGDAISNGAWVPYGTSVKYDASAESGYSLAWFTASDYASQFTTDPYWFHTATSTGNGYAKFTEKATTVTLANDGHGKVQISSTDKTSTTCGVTTTRSLTAVPNTGYSFSSWTKTSGDDIEISNAGTNPTTLTGLGAGATSGQIVTANFTAKTYTVTLNNDHGGEGSDDGSATATYDATSLSDITDAQFSGWTLLGYWNNSAVQVTDANGDLQANVDGYTDGSAKWTKDGDANLWAHWSRSVSLDREDGTTGSTSMTVIYKSSTLGSYSAPTKTGYNFAGYYTGDNGTGTMVINTSGVLQSNVTGYTNSDGQWTKEDATTLYAKWTPATLTFTGATDSDWDKASNWLPAYLPTIEHDVVLNVPVEVNIDHATAKSIVIDQNGDNTGKLTIQANKGLEVTGTIQVYNGSSYGPTAETDLILESDATGNATLIFDNSNSDQATVQMYSKGWTTGTQGSGTWNWQFVGVPVTDATRINDYYNGYMYEWSSGWVDKTDMYGALTPFAGYSATYPTDEDHLHTYSIDGTLVPTDDKSIDIPTGTSVYAVANSWTAPIYVKNITFSSEPANVYIFNTGYAASKAAIGDRWAANTYHAVPVNSSPYTGDSLIASMQGFFVKTTSGTMTINYDDVVRPTGTRNINAGEMHAPQRQMEAEPVVMKIYVSDSLYDDRVVLLAREDFSRGFDNGWDGEKFQVNAVTTAPRLFAINETGGKEEVSAIPELENTVLGFRPGTEETYTIHFDYNGDETLYLRDTRTGSSTLITNESKYIFLSDGTNEDARFIISRVQSTPTGTEEIGAGSKAYKLMIEDHIYIIRDGRMYSVDGALVK